MSSSEFQNNRSIIPTAKQIKQLCNNHGLPFPTFEPQYVSYYVDLYDKLHNAKYKYQLLLQLLEKDTNLDIEAFTMKLANKIIEDVKATAAYKELSQRPLNVKCGELPCKFNVYKGHKPEYIPFISIDMKEANFSAIRYYAPEVLYNCKCWQQFVTRYTDIPFITESKHFRQVVMGMLFKGLPSNIQKYLASVTYSALKDIINVAGAQGNDEMIIKTTPETMVTDCNKISLTLDALPSNGDWKFTSLWRIEPFFIKSIGKSQAFERRIVTHFSNMAPKEQKLAVKNISRDFKAQAYKHVIGLPFTINDRRGLKDKLPITYDSFMDF
jgi:hypothetical protein